MKMRMKRERRRRKYENDAPEKNKKNTVASGKSDKTFSLQFFKFSFLFHLRT